MVGRPLDPYNQNKLKGDFPVFGSSSLFMNTNLQLNTALNPRQVGKGDAQSQFFNNNNFVGGIELFKGDTVFQPKSWALRATVVGNVNDNTANGLTVTERTSASRKRSSRSGWRCSTPRSTSCRSAAACRTSTATSAAICSSTTSWVSGCSATRAAIATSTTSAFFSMRQRDTASQLHSFDNRDQTVVIGNYYVQDFAVPGYTAMFNVHVNHDNGVPNDPHALQVAYVGFHGDGKWGPWSVSHAFYQAFGKDDDNRVARSLNANANAAAPVDISAQMAALEVSRDADWLRYRGSLFFASGDDRGDRPKRDGFDSITDNPNLAGGQFMFFDQQNTRSRASRPRTRRT